MRLWEFEPQLVDALNAVDRVTARSYRDADYGHSYGVEVRTDSGASARIRLIGASDSRVDAPAEHAANMARLDGREAPPVVVIGDDVAARIEQLLLRLITGDRFPGLREVRSFEDRRVTLGLRTGSADRGVHVVFDNGNEVFATVAG